jgi:hypothetical protein
VHENLNLQSKEEICVSLRQRMSTAIKFGSTIASLLWRFKDWIFNNWRIMLSFQQLTSIEMDISYFASNLNWDISSTDLFENFWNILDTTKKKMLFVANPWQSMLCHVLWIKCQVIKAQALSSMDRTCCGKLYGELDSYNNVKGIHPNLNLCNFLYKRCSMALYIWM